MRSPPLDVLITIDTEVWPRGPGGTRWIGSDLSEHIRRDVFGVTARGDYGLSYQMDVLDAHGLRAVFLVESLFACAAGIEPLGTIVATIQGRGHEVQLHVHPEWLAWMPDSILPGRFGQNLREFSEGEQELLLGHGLDNLRRAGATVVRAFRAGNYGADLATLRVLARLGIPFDTSYNACYLHGECSFHQPDRLVQPRLIAGVREVPISFFSDYPGHYRHAQLGACSYREMRRALLQAWQLGWRTFVLVFHSFEFLRRDRFGVPVAPDWVVIGRFRKLCRFLAEDREKFRTVGFSDLDLSSTTSPAPTRQELRSSLHLTTLRYGEQLVRRLQR